jgi:hypothetical protein
MKRKLIETIALFLQLVIAFATFTAFQPKLYVGVYIASREAWEVGSLSDFTINLNWGNKKGGVVERVCLGALTNREANLNISKCV